MEWVNRKPKRRSTKSVNPTTTNNLHIGVPEMKSVLFAIIAIAALAYVVWSREARTDEFSAPAWAKAYHTSGTFGATDGDCDPPKPGALFAFCDAEQTDPCDTTHLMVKDVCEDTIRELTDGSARFSCAPVNAATRDAYLRTLEPDKLANTFRAWREER